MAISSKQAYVLDNLDRVKPMKYQNDCAAPRERHQLDGWECSDQIRGLLVRGRVGRKPDGKLERIDHFPATCNVAMT